MLVTEKRQFVKPPCGIDWLIRKDRGEERSDRVGLSLLLDSLGSFVINGSVCLGSLPNKF